MYYHSTVSREETNSLSACRLSLSHSFFLIHILTKSNSSGVWRGGSGGSFFFSRPILSLLMSYFFPTCFNSTIPPFFRYVLLSLPSSPSFCMFTCLLSLSTPLSDLTFILGAELAIIQNYLGWRLSFKVEASRGPNSAVCQEN